MRRALVTTAAVIALVVNMGGCASPAAPAAPPAMRTPAVRTPAGHARASGSPGARTQAEAEQAGVYAQVLRRYLSSPAENSFPGQAFTTVYVIDKAYADAADPNGTHGRATPIAPEVQRQVTAALAGMAHVTFIVDRESVIVTTAGCWEVRNGGILITLGPPVRHGDELQVGINGSVACAGATWLTYVLRDQPGVGWRVTGTTGTMAIA
jgi:hypothetical protein